MLALAAPPYVPVYTSTAPLDVRLGYVNTDTLVDLVALNTDGSLTVALNQGDDNWQNAQTTQLGLNTAVYGMELFRLPGDSLADVVVQGADAITLFRSNGLGGWSLHGSMSSPAPGSFAPADGGRVKPAATLLNDDPVFDLAVPSPETGEVVVYLGTNSGGHGTGTPYSTGVSQPVAVVAGQFIGTAWPDLAVGHRDGTVVFLEGLGDGTFAVHSGATVTGLGTILDLVAGDYNGDGEQDLVVTGGDRVTLLTNEPDPAPTPRIVNGDFAQGVTGWTTEVVGHAAGATPGAVSALGGVAQFRENESFLVSLQQTFVVPPTPQSISFDLVAMGLADPAGGIPDAFEVSLLDANSNSVVATIGPQATSFFNLNPGNVVSTGTGATFDGRHATLDISALTPGESVTLVFDLVGNPPGSTSVAAIDNVVVSPSFVAANSFLARRLTGLFTGASGIAQGDVDGDGQIDLVVADSSANQLVVYAGNGQGTFTRSEYSLASFGNNPTALAIGPQTAGDVIGDVAVALTGSNLVLTPLGIDQIPPQATLLTPAPGETVTGAVTQIVVQFSEAMQDSGPASPHSVTNPAAYLLSTPGPNGTFDGGGDDVLIPLSGVTYDAIAFRASVQIAAAAAPLADGSFQIRVAGSDPAFGLRDVAGNLLGNGTDLVAEFGVNRVGPVNLAAAALSGDEGQLRTLVATFDNPGINSSHSATINWGDGVTETAIVTFANGHGDFTAQHVYSDNGSYTIHLEVSDDSLAGLVDPTALDTTATVGNVPPTLIVSANRPALAGTPASLVVGTFTDPGFDNPALPSAESFSATIDWGDGSAPTAGVVTVVQGSSGVLTTGQIVGAHAYANLGAYQVTVTVSDDDGGSSQGTFTISTRQRFAVVDQSAHELFTYDPDFDLLTNPDLGQYNSAPRGITTTATGDTFWVVDASRRIVVYDRGGTQLGQWNSTNATQPQGIAIDGPNLWIVGAAQDKFYFYANGAALRSGTVSASSTFSLHAANNKASDLVTDGKRIWVTDEGTSPKVYVYSMTGALLGSWSIDAQNVEPSGIALDNVTGTLWIVDRHTATVFEYPGAASFLAGSHSAAAQYALAPDNINPEGITDPTIPINIGDTVVDSIAVAGEVDLFPFSATAGQSVFIDFQALSGGITNVRLLAPGGAVVAAKSSEAGSLDNGPFTLATSGTYTLEVTAAGTRTYQFKLWNVPLITTPISIGQVVPGAISVPGEHDRYTFTGTAGQQLFFDVHGNAFHPFSQVEFALFKPDGTTLFGVSPTDRDTFVLPVGGTYTVEVDGGIILDNTNTYEFQIWEVPATVTLPITIGPVVTGEISVPGEQDRFTFSGLAGQKILFDIHNNLVHPFNQVLYSLLKPDGTTLFGFRSDDLPIFALPDNGTYTVIMDGGIPDTTRVYEFQIWNIQPPVLSAITIGQRVQQAIDFPGQERGYTFSGTIGQRLVVDMSGNSGLGLDLRRPDGSLLLPRQWGDRDVFILDQAGTYTVVLGSLTFIDNTGAFDFTLYESPADESRSIPLNTAVSDVLGYGQRFTYTFAAQAGDELFFDVQQNAGGIPFTLRAPNGAVVFSNRVDDFFLTPLTQAGTYTLTASGWAGFSLASESLRRGVIAFQLQKIPSPQPGSRDSQGTEFWLTFPNNLNAGPFGSELPAELTLYIAARTATTGVVRVPGVGNFGAAFTVPAGEMTAVRLPASAELSGSVIQNKGIQVLATSEVSVYGFNQWPATTDAFLGLPADALGTEYVLMSYPGIPGFAGSSLGLVAIQDATVVEITPTAAAGGRPAGVPFTITLQRGQAFHLSASGAADLTGTTVTANRPFAAFGANFITRVPNPLQAANHLVEQLPPVATWGKRFVTVPFATRTGGDVFRLLAARNGTEVRINGTLVATLNRGQFHEVNLTAAVEIVSSQPLLVAQFAHSSEFDHAIGDPTMMLVPPHEQFQNSYTIAAPTSGFDTNYVNVVIAASAVGTVELDGLLISAALFAPIGGSGLSGAQVPIAPGTHHLEGPHPFGVFSYGFDDFDAYGYTGGTSLGPVALATQLVLSPGTATLAVGTLQSFTATVTNAGGQPLAGVRVDFAVSGPNGTTGFAFTDTQGRAIFSYSGAAPGTDTVTANVGTIADSSSIFWSATPPSVVFSSPDSGSEHRTGSFVLITGIAQPGVVGSRIAAVTIDGHSVDAFDAAGHFFATVQIAAGANGLTVTATDTLGQIGQATLLLVGIPGSTGGFDFAQAQDVTSQAQFAYAATTYNRRTETLHAEARLTNTGADPLRGPVLAVFDRIAPAAVTLASAEGTNLADQPWIAFDSQLGAQGLAPGATSQPIDLRFANPNQQRFEPFVSLLAAGNLPPQFVSLPLTLTVIGQTYAYTATAADPNHDTLTYRVLSGPSNLVINSATGFVSWTPLAEQTGAFQLEIEADDGFGGRATQQFQVQVFASYPNRPPIFQSAPQTLVEPGTNYVYQPVVADADGHALQFFLDAAPAGMSVSASTGRIDFPSAAAGNYQITLRAEDGHGGRASQTYILTVGAGTASNVPQIVSTPPVLGVVGELYLYLPNVVNPLAATIVFTLPQSPPGMTINPATGELRWTPTAGQTGLAEVTLQVSDQLGDIVVQRFAINVAALAPNQPPVFDSMPPRFGTEGIQLVYPPAAHDPEGQPLSFALDEGPAGATFSTQTGQLTWTPAHADLGFHLLRLRALDPAGAAALQTFYVEVRPPNFAPQFTSPPLTETTAGTPYRDLVTATDADDAFSFSLVAGPSGMFIDRRSGLLFWRSTPADAGGCRRPHRHPPRHRRPRRSVRPHVHPHGLRG
jgi:IgGFc binding protein/Putative Ig domain/FG-GAP-like repeat